MTTAHLGEAGPHPVIASAARELRLRRSADQQRLFHDLRTGISVPTILGGSGGHADTAAGAQLAIVTTKLAAAAGPKFVEMVRCVTTPGETIDAVVTELGVAVNPRREDLQERLLAAGLDVFPICELRRRAQGSAPAPPQQARDELEQPVVAVIEYRDGRVSDVVRRVAKRND